MPAARTFHIPQELSYEQKVAFCLQIIEKQRAEVFPLRKKVTICQTYHDDLIAEVYTWKDKYEREKVEKQKLEKEIEKLKKEIEKLTKTNSRYQVGLFDHGNFKHPDKKDKKRKGGQLGHKDTNQDKNRDVSSWKRQRLFATHCGNCGKELSRVNGVKEKALIDIQINTQLIELIMQSERQWCGNCKKEVTAKSAQTLPFTEYGMNTFMVVMLLRVQSHQSLLSIRKTLFVCFGLLLSKSDIVNLLRSAKEYLREKYEQLKKAIREGELIYKDETGWYVRGQKAWMWIMANEEATVYVAAESRGKGIAKDMYADSSADVMTDGLPSYTNVIPEGKHAYCWSHMLRFAYEETGKLTENHTACQIRDRLVDLYQTIRSHSRWSKEEKEAILRKELDSLISIQSTEETVKNILFRLKTQKEGLILALLITEDGTNNLSERELRNMAIKRTISYGSDSFKGMETTAILGSIIQTLGKEKAKPLLPTLQHYLCAGIQKKYPQYKHQPSCAP